MLLGVSLGEVVWVLGGYLAGTLPFPLLVARVRRAGEALSAARRADSAADAHQLLRRRVGSGWTAVAATLDVVKAFAFALAARLLGKLSIGWVAMVGLALVLGHCFPFYARVLAGRGLAAAAGVYLAILPVEMVAAGLLIVAGGILRVTGEASTMALAMVPVAAALMRRPWEAVAMAVGVFVVIMLRRLEGIGNSVREGLSPPKAVLYRCVFDSSRPPSELP